MPLVWISLSFIAGIISADLLHLPLLLWFSAGLALLFFATLWALLARRGALVKIPFLYFAVLIALCWGGARYEYQQPDFDDPFFIAFYNDRRYEMLVTGALDEPPDIRDGYANLKIRAEAIDSGSGDLPANGLLLARIPHSQLYKSSGEILEYGDRVRLRGELKTPPENEEFSYRDYLARSGVYASMTKAEVTLLPGNSGNVFFRGVYKLKNKLLQNIYIIYHDPEASLLAGILLGVDTGLPPELQQAFKDTGTAHIIAISGFNIAIIGGLFFSVFKKILGERFGALLAAAGIIFYTLLVGADAAVVRAAIMGTLSLLARQVGKRNSGLNGLAFAALLMLLRNPLYLWDVGFQLSGLATLGLILYAEPFSNFTANLLSNIFHHDISAFTRFINDNVVLTFAAQLTTIPIMAYHFKRISLISFIANPFILPAQPMVMILGGLAAFASLVFLPLGQVLAWAATPFPFYTIRIVEFFGSLPNGVLVLKDSSLWYVIATYAALFAVTFGWDSMVKWYHAQKESLRAAAYMLTFTALFICVVLVWQANATSGDGKLHLTFLEVGSANGIFLQTPEGRTVLINGGSSASALSDGLGRRLPVFAKNIDWLIVASPAERELAALPRVLERYPPTEVLWSGNIQASYPAQQLTKFFARREIPVTHAEVGQKLELGKDMFIEILSTGSRGSALLVEYKNFRALLPIGVDAETYTTLENVKSLGKIDVVLLADSGYAPSNPPEVIKNANPQLVILSVEAGDPNGLPHEEVLESLRGYSLLRTDLNGWIDIITDGNELRVEVQRGNREPTPTP